MVSPQLQLTVQLILVTLVGIVGTAVAYNGIRFIREKLKEVRTRIGAEQFYIIDQLVEIVVKAAEQAHLKEQAFETGEQMLGWAVDQLQGMLDSRGLTGIDVEELAQRIRAALRDGVHKADEETEPTFPVTPTE